MRINRVLWLAVVVLPFLVLFTGCGVPQETYDNLVQEHATLQENHQNLGTQKVALQDRFSSLQDRLSSLEKQHASLRESYEEIRHQQSTLLGNYDTAIGEIEVQIQRSDTLAERVESLSDENKSYSNRNLELETENASLSSAIGDISNQFKQAQAELSDLRAVNASIKARVSELEERLDGYYVSGFRCTRSMVPYIDCGDEAVWKGAFDSTDISVGTVISFQAPSNCGSLSGKPIAHRVTEIRIVDGEPQYQTQGDNNSRPDPCWIPRQDVQGVLALLRNDARPGDVVDSVQYDKALQKAQDIEADYNSAESQYRAAEAIYEQADASYSAVYDDYAAKYSQYCGFPPGRYRTCSLRDPAYTEVNALYSRVQSLFQALETERQRVKGLASDLKLLASQLNTAWSEVKRLRCETFDICS